MAPLIANTAPTWRGTASSFAWNASRSARVCSYIAAAARVGEGAAIRSAFASMSFQMAPWSARRSPHAAIE